MLFSNTRGTKGGTKDKGSNTIRPLGAYIGVIILVLVPPVVGYKAIIGVIWL